MGTSNQTFFQDFIIKIYFIELKHLSNSWWILIIKVIRSYKIMQKYTLIFVLVLLLANESQSASFNATVSCTPCTKACGFSSCYKIESENWSSVVCGSESCPYTKSIVVKFDKCSYDSLGSSCSTQVCFYYNSTGCFGSSSSVLGMNTVLNVPIQFGCGNCQQTSNCNKCYQVIAPNLTLEPTCLGNSCNNAPTYSMTINNCANNMTAEGNSCTYCYKIENATGSIGVCTTQRPQYSATDFTVYAYARVLAEKTISIVMLSIVWIGLMGIY